MTEVQVKNFVFVSSIHSLKHQETNSINWQKYVEKKHHFQIFFEK